VDKQCSSVPRISEAWRGQLCERLHLDKRRQPRTQRERGGHRAAVTGKTSCVGATCGRQHATVRDARCAGQTNGLRCHRSGATGNCGHGADTSAARRRSFPPKSCGLGRADARPLLVAADCSSANRMKDSSSMRSRLADHGSERVVGIGRPKPFHLARWCRLQHPARWPWPRRTVASSSSLRSQPRSQRNPVEVRQDLL